jgi:hypothetical protein
MTFINLTKQIDNKLKYLQIQEIIRIQILYKIDKNISYIKIIQVMRLP